VILAVFLIACVAAGALPLPRWVPWLLPALALFVGVRWIGVEAGWWPGTRSNPPETDVAAFMTFVIVGASIAAVAIGRLLRLLYDNFRRKRAPTQPAAECFPYQQTTSTESTTTGEQQARGWPRAVRHG
jgi:hypothetical protein